MTKSLIFLDLQNQLMQKILEDHSELEYLKKENSDEKVKLVFYSHRYL